MKQEFADTLAEHRLIAILRGVPAESLEAVGDALVAAGFRLIEVTFGQSDTMGQIRRLRSHLPSDVMIGAGTVTSRERAIDAERAGASFLVSPHVTLEVCDYAADEDLGMVCGALTPTEVHLASQRAEAVKIFPASAMGPSYFSALMDPFPDLKLLAVGGVDEASLATYLEAGALGAGIGSSLTNLGADGLKGIAQRATQYVETIKAHLH